MLDPRLRMQIGPHTFPGRFFLAPLAGVSDRPFRAICRGMGASFAYTEMVSAHGLVHGTLQTESYLDRDPEEEPFAVQLFAAEPDVLARGAAVAVRAGAGIIDVNMACPVKKVCGTGAGASLGREPARVEKAVRAIRAAVPVPVTVKIRALGSGDVWTVEDALRMRAETGCDAVLVARGACGNPWIFHALRAAERGEPRPAPPSREEWIAVMLRHVELQIAHRRRQRTGEPEAEAERAAVRELRKHLLWYTRGRRGGAVFRRDADRLHTAADVARSLETHFPPGSPAFEEDPGEARTDGDEA